MNESEIFGSSLINFKVEIDYTVSTMGSSLGASFFRETLKAIYVSFLLMGIVLSFFTGLLGIFLVLTLLKYFRLQLFAWYRIILGIGVLYFFVLKFHHTKAKLLHPDSQK